MRYFKRLIISALLLLLPITAYADILSTYDYNATRSFADVSTDFWAYSAISSLGANGLISGYPDGTFKPQGIITRSEAVKILGEYMNCNFDVDYDFAYADVSTDDWYYHYAYSGAAFLPEIYDSNNLRIFSGNTPLTRGEAMYAAVHIIYAEDELTYYDESKLFAYSDYDSIQEFLRPYATVAIDKGIVQGYNDNTLRANVTVTRAEFATLIYRCLHPSFNVSIHSARAELVQGYNDSFNLGITFEKRGSNNLPDFGDWYFINKSNKSFDFEALTPFKTACTDYFSPYIVRANENADGDMPYSSHFTGGNHSYNNTALDGSATARNEELRFSVNGSEVQYYNGGAVYVDIYYTNYIHASNTKKFDGSGREVLKETNRIHFDGDKYKFSIRVEALEDISIMKYYGAQFDLLGIVNTVTYVSDSGRRDSFGVESGSVSSDRQCFTIELSDGVLDVEIAVDNPIPEQYNSTNHSAFYEPYGKTYFNIINSPSQPFVLNKGDSFTLNGYYRFG